MKTVPGTLLLLLLSLSQPALDFTFDSRYRYDNQFHAGFDPMPPLKYILCATLRDVFPMGLIHVQPQNRDKRQPSTNGEQELLEKVFPFCPPGRVF